MPSTVKQVTLNDRQSMLLSQYLMIPITVDEVSIAITFFNEGDSSQPIIRIDSIELDECYGITEEAGIEKAVQFFVAASKCDVPSNLWNKLFDMDEIETICYESED